MSGVLSPRGYRVSQGRAHASMQFDLTMVPTSHASMPTKEKSFALYNIDGDDIYVPKYYGLKTFGVASECTLDPGVSINVPFTGSLRPEQLLPTDKFMEAAHDDSRLGGILSLSCGQGKTVIALGIISKLAKRTLIIVHKDFLLNQWRERIAEFLPTARIGIIKGKILDVEDKDIIIASVQSLSMKHYDDETFRGIGLLIVDECHRLGTEVFSKSLMKMTFKVTLGLSATVVRKDGMTKAFVYFLGDIVFKGERREDRVKVVQRRFECEDPAYSKEEMIASIGKPNMSRMINNICSYPPRNIMIADMIADILVKEPERKVLVLSDRKVQLTSLMSHMTTRGITAGYYYGGLKAAQLEESEKKQVLLATFAYAAEGMDCPSLDTLFLVSPKSDIEQSCGRILREKKEVRKRVPLIVDIVDAFSLFERQAAKRRTYYKKNSYTIVGGIDDVNAGVNTTTYAFR